LRRSVEMPVRVMVVERYRFVRDALRIAIAPVAGLELVVETGDADEAVCLAMDQEPDVIVLDVGWPSLEGLAAAPRLREVAPQACIVMYSSDPEFEAGYHGFEAGGAAITGGADAYLPAASTLKEMVALLLAVPSSTGRAWRFQREAAAG
jgi:DNA-binding NarL/FixJ family response regulator